MNNKNRKIFIIGILALIIIIIIGTFLTTRPNHAIIIENLSAYADKVSKTRTKEIQTQLYAYVKTQNSLVSKKTKSTYKSQIRENSYSETTFTSPDNIVSYNANFILDIPNLEYSYRVKFSWVKNNEKIDVGEVEVLCLDKSELIYPDFNCSNNPMISKDDEILSVLPYFGESFILTPTLSATSKSGYGIVIEYDPPEEVYLGTNFDAFIEQQKQLMRDYLKSKSININNYEIIERYKIY